MRKDGERDEREVSSKLYYKLSTATSWDFYDELPCQITSYGIQIDFRNLPHGIYDFRVGLTVAGMKLH